MIINFHNQTSENVTEYEQIIASVFYKFKSKKTFQIIFVNENTIKRINNDYRKIDKATDVLSFVSDEKDSLGDVFICIEYAIKQAHELGHSIQREISFLAVHGYLHLIGYDHLTSKEEKKMIKKQNKILNK